MNTSHRKIELFWARLGILFNCAPLPRAPDIERLLLETARQLPSNARLFPLVVTWLAKFGVCVAKHRLRGLALRELELVHRPALGLLLESAIELGAPRDLAIVCEVCRPATEPRPLFDVYREAPSLAALAHKNASDVSARWGLWTPPIDLQADALRNTSWLLARNPELRPRFIRKGDLRCSILETLRLDLDGVAGSESELARLCAASRAAVKKSLEALIAEGELVSLPGQTPREGHPVRLVAA